MNIDNQIKEVLRIAGIEQIDEISKEEYTTLKSKLSGNILCHGTDLLHAYYIFQSNCLKGYTPIKSVNNTNDCGVSTSRSYQTALDYVQDKGEEYLTNFYPNKFMFPIIVFALDKQKLNNNHKIIPYDFYRSGDSEDATGYYESEEVIVGDIKNVKDNIQGLILNNDTRLLLDNDEIGKFLLMLLYKRLRKKITPEQITIDLIKKAFPYVDEFTQFLKNNLVYVLLNEEILELNKLGEF